MRIAHEWLTTKRLCAQVADPMFVAVGSLGIHQIAAWGTSYYCLGVLAVPIGIDTGWSLSLIYFGFTVALLTMGLVSTWVGRAIDYYGARMVMTIGTLLVSIGLLVLSLVRSEATYLAVWVFIGLGMRMCLYDAAFAALVQVLPSRGRLAISYLTLFGAFASSVFWVTRTFPEWGIRLASNAGAVRCYKSDHLPAAQFHLCCSVPQAMPPFSDSLRHQSLSLMRLRRLCVQWLSTDGVGRVCRLCYWSAPQLPGWRWN